MDIAEEDNDAVVEVAPPQEVSQVKQVNGDMNAARLSKFEGAFVDLRVCTWQRLTIGSLWLSKFILTCSLMY